MFSLESNLKILSESEWLQVLLLPTVYGGEALQLQIPNYKLLNRVVIVTSSCSIVIDVNVKYGSDVTHETFIFDLKRNTLEETHKIISDAVWKPAKRVEEVYLKEIEYIFQPPRKIHFYTDNSYLDYKYPMKSALDKCVAIEFIKEVESSNIRFVLAPSQDFPFHIDIAVGDLECQEILKGKERFEMQF